MQKVFTIYDSKVECYERPWVAPSKGAALRALLDVFNDKNHPYTKWSGDYTLFELGTWDEQTGTFVPHLTKIHCGVLIELAPLANDSNQTVRPIKTVSDQTSTEEGQSVTRQ